MTSLIKKSHTVLSIFLSEISHDMKLYKEIHILDNVYDISTSAWAILRSTMFY